jgi:hypothetical protein
MIEVDQPSHIEGPTTLVQVGHDPYQWSGPRLTWSDQNQQGALSVFMLDDVKEQGY